MNDEKITFADMDSYQGSGSGKFQLTFKQICLMHINRCVVNGSVEYRGGFYEQKLSTQGGMGAQIVKTYVESKIDIFCNSVRILRALLQVHFKEEDNTKKDKILRDKLQDIIKKYKKSNEEKKEYTKIAFQEDKIDIYMDMFELLLRISKKLNFFEERESVEEMK